MRKLILAALALTRLAAAQSSLMEVLESKTINEVRKLEDQNPGVIGFAAIDLKTQRVFSYHGDVVFAQASSIKIPIMIEMFRAASRGKFQMTDKLTLTAKDAVGGSGHSLGVSKREKP